MNMSIRLAFFWTLLMAGFAAGAQRIVYSNPDREDTRRMNFEVIGKVGGNFLVYKNLRNNNYVSVYNQDMEQVARENQSYLPDERLINVDFFPYPDFVHVVYQYQKKNVVYCDAIKINGQGKAISQPQTLDTSHIGFSNSSRIYSAFTNEAKSDVMVVKVNARNRERFVVTSMLFNDSLQLRNRSVMPIAMEERNDYLDEFGVDNDGDLVFVKFSRNNNENVSKVWLMHKPAMADSLMVYDIGLKDLFLDEIHIKVDNANKRYLLTSYSYKQRRGNIDALYCWAWDKMNRLVAMESSIPLSDELKREARGDANVKNAFNDHFIRNVVVKKDGGFLIGSEAYYTTSRFNNWNRWDYMGMGMGMWSPMDFYAWNPGFYSPWAWRSNRFNNNGMVRHHADNVALLSVDGSGKLQWSSVIHKEQFDDESDDRLSYQILNTGGQLHFLFNQDERRASRVLNDYVLVPDGTINRNPTLKNLDRNYEFMPRFAKQVGSRQLIVPCYYRNYIAFAKLDYNS